MSISKLAIRNSRDMSRPQPSDAERERRLDSMQQWCTSRIQPLNPKGKTVGAILRDCRRVRETTGLWPPANQARPVVCCAIRRNEGDHGHRERPQASATCLNEIDLVQSKPANSIIQKAACRNWQQPLLPRRQTRSRSWSIFPPAKLASDGRGPRRGSPLEVPASYPP